MKQWAMAVVAGVALTACGGGTSFSGSVKGDKLTVKAAAATKMSVAIGPVSVTAPFVVLSDQENVCDNLKNSVMKKGSSTFALLFGATDANGKLTTPTSTGDYNVNTAAIPLVATGSPNAPKNTNFNFSAFEKLDDSCASTFNSANGDSGENFVTSGNVKLTTLKLEASGSAAGTFDVTFTSGDHVTGAFNAPYCDANLTLNITNIVQPSSGNNPSCQ